MDVWKLDIFFMSLSLGVGVGLYENENGTMLVLPESPLSLVSISCERVDDVGRDGASRVSE